MELHFLHDLTFSIKWVLSMLVAFGDDSDEIIPKFGVWIQMKWIARRRNSFLIKKKKRMSWMKNDEAADFFSVF